VDGTIDVERGDRRATVTVNSPARLNAISVSMWRELARVFGGFAADEAVHCIVVRGAGGNFAAGADIEEFAAVRFDRESGRRFHLEVLTPALEAIRRAPQTVIAAIEGMCIGGGLEIALACDLRIAADNARLGAPVGRLGFPLALPELQPLLELVGPGVAADLLLAGRVLEARDAAHRGLVQRVVAGDHLRAEVDRIVGDVLAGSPLAARINKRQIRLLMDQAMRYSERDLASAFDFLDSDDYRAGVAAFLAKRRPDFTGR
jgi:enoyl-CoA hydratase/carnithine racemase